MKPSKPTLFDLSETPPALNLLMKRCPQCEQLNFPANVPGCRVCGTCLTQTPIEQLPGIGILKKSIILNMSLGTDIQAPSLVGELELAPGLIRQAILQVDNSCQLHPEQTLQAIAMPSYDSDQYNCVFVPLKKEQS